MWTPGRRLELFAFVFFAMMPRTEFMRGRRLMHRLAAGGEYRPSGKASLIKNKKGGACPSANAPPEPIVETGLSLRLVLLFLLGFVLLFWRRLLPLLLLRRRLLALCLRRPLLLMFLLLPLLNLLLLLLMLPLQVLQLSLLLLLHLLSALIVSSLLVRALPFLLLLLLDPLPLLVLLPVHVLELLLVLLLKLRISVRRRIRRPRRRRPIVRPVIVRRSIRLYVRRRRVGPIIRICRSS